MPGTHGLQSMVCQGATDVNTFDSSKCDFSIITSFSGRFEQGEKYIDHISGLFKAPVDGIYTFYAYGDDETYLIFEGTDTISSSPIYDLFGNIFANTPVSKTLTAGQYYSLKLKHSEGGYGDFS